MLTKKLDLAPTSCKESLQAFFAKMQFWQLFFSVNMACLLGVKRGSVRSTPSGKHVANVNIDKFLLRGRALRQSFGGAPTPQRELCSVLADKKSAKCAELCIICKLVKNCAKLCKMYEIVQYRASQRKLPLQILR